MPVNGQAVASGLGIFSLCMLGTATKILVNQNASNQETSPNENLNLFLSFALICTLGSFAAAYALRPTPETIKKAENQAIPLVKAMLYGNYDSFLLLPKTTASHLIHALYNSKCTTPEDLKKIVRENLPSDYAPLAPELVENFQEIIVSLGMIKKDLKKNYAAEKNYYNDRFVTSLTKTALLTVVGEHAQNLITLPPDLAKALIEYITAPQEEPLTEQILQKHLSNHYAARFKALEKQGIAPNLIIEELLTIRGLCENNKTNNVTGLIKNSLYTDMQSQEKAIATNIQPNFSMLTHLQISNSKVDSQKSL